MAEQIDGAKCRHVWVDDRHGIDFVCSRCGAIKPYQDYFAERDQARTGSLRVSNAIILGGSLAAALLALALA
jgi:hypothetical protein